MATERKSSEKSHGGEACLLKPDDFSDHDLPDDDFPDNKERRVDGDELFRPGNDIRYFLEKIRIGNCPIRGRRL